MAWPCWLKPEAEPSEGGFATFRQELLLFFAGFTFYGGWLLFLWVPETRTATQHEMAVGAAALVVSALTLLARKRWPGTTSWFFVIASLPLNSLIFVVFHQEVALSLFALATLAAGLLLGPWPCVGTGAASTALIMVLHANPILSPTGPFWLVLVVAALGLGILSGRAMRLADYWERETTLGQKRYIERLRDRQGELNRTLKALDEAYETLKRTNSELRVARQAAEEARVLKEQFVANISHELRTPLNLIVGFAEVMYLAPETYGQVNWTPLLEGDIQEIYRASRHLQSLVDDILDLSRIDAARLPMFRELQDVRAIISEAADTVAPLLRQRHLSYRAEWPEELPGLLVDRTRIRQVLLNLFNNAIRHTEKGGITVRITQGENALLISVQDTGTGIPSDQLESIFERFRQVDGGLRRAGGVGLGLALSRQFIELHGGRMWAESQVGEGSTFFISLPLPGAVPQTTSLLHTPDSQQVDTSVAPIVVVDPDPTISSMLSRYLGDHRILKANDLEDAEALIESEHPLAVIVNQPPDVPAESWLGPLGEQSRRYGVPILRCSIPSSSWLQEGNGFAAWLAKPVSQADLKGILDKHAAHSSRILVVDDDPGFVRLMVRMLRTFERDFQVFAAYSGMQAINMAGEKKPDLVLLDLAMPEMDGFAVLRAWQADPALAGIAVVAVTAAAYLGEEALEQRGTQLTLTQSLHIPSGTLVELLNSMLGIVRPNYLVPSSVNSQA